MKKMMAAFEAECERIEVMCSVKEHALDFIDTYTSEEIAQMVREGIFTVEEVEAGLRRRIGG